MLIHAGFNIAFDCSVATPLLLMVHIRPERQADLREPEKFTLYPQVPYRTYTDGFGNVCTRLTAPAGRVSIWNRFLIEDSGREDVLPIGARQMAVEELPNDALVFLLGSRYCETDKLLPWHGPCSAHAARLAARAGDLQYTHDRMRSATSMPARTAPPGTAYCEQRGVCRDFAHLAIALFRCMNIPARYCTGYLGDIGVPPIDVADGFQRLVGSLSGRGVAHRRCTPQHPRIGRIVMARGRDAADAAISTAFGMANLVEFSVITDEVAGS